MLENVKKETIMDIVFLGTASGYPSPHRGASGLVLRDLQRGDYWLFDCGEGTQIQAQRSANVRMGRISRIFISHLHGDHVYGLPGLLCTIDQKSKAGEIDGEDVKEERTDDTASVHIYGPQGLRRFLRLALALSRTHLSYTIAVHELIMRPEHQPPDWVDWAALTIDPNRDPPLHCERPGRDIEADPDGFWRITTAGESCETKIYAMALRHSIPSVGWLLLKPQEKPSLCVEIALSLGVPQGRLMGELKRGQSVVIDGKTIKPEQVLKPPIRGLRIAIMGDSYDSSELVRLIRMLAATGQMDQPMLDVLVHEATLEHGMKDNALAKGHSTSVQATELAAQMETRLLILTHFSHRYTPVGRDAKDDNSNTESTKSHKKDKPSLQVLLDEANSVEFNGQVILADDLSLIPISPVSKTEMK